MKNTFLLVLPALMLFGCSGNGIKVSLSNNSKTDRKSETVEIPISDITERITDASLQELIVVDRSGKEIPSQLIFNGYDKPVSLIFQANVPAASDRLYRIKKGHPQKYIDQAYGRFVPERMDDYAWENDRIAFRIYGTALIKKDGPSNGLDVWVKRTDEMVINKWYSEYLAGKNTYHNDNGQGCDCYKVGRTLGAGAMAPYVNDSLWLGINFVSYQTLDNGPIRTSFRLTYPPLVVNGDTINETRSFSLDAFSQLNRVTEEYKGINEPFTVAAGIAERPEGKILSDKAEDGYIAYSLDAGENGTIYLGTILLSDATGVTETNDHLLIKTQYSPDSGQVYYTGAGWNKWGFESSESWIKYLSEFRYKLKNPLSVSLK
jgi:hypothetical protein